MAFDPNVVAEVKANEVEAFCELFEDVDDRAEFAELCALPRLVLLLTLTSWFRLDLDKVWDETMTMEIVVRLLLSRATWIVMKTKSTSAAALAQSKVSTDRFIVYYEFYETF